MKLIYVDKNTKINPERISWVELKSRYGQEILSIVVDGREFEVGRPIEEFLSDIEECCDEEAVDKFAG